MFEEPKNFNTLIYPLGMSILNLSSAAAGVLGETEHQLTLHFIPDPCMHIALQKQARKKKHKSNKIATSNFYVVFNGSRVGKKSVCLLVN